MSMGPERIDTKAGRTRVSSEMLSTHRNRGSWKKHKDSQNAVASELPGVQKLKAAIRQTRRFLARDNLAADVRRDTERRLASLESDLQTAELQRKERAMAKRYHKVKFFERQKVLRRIKKAKKEIERKEAGLSKEAVTQLQDALFEQRVQLNYILNYPKLEKYISLFPPSEEKDEQNLDLADTSQPPITETDSRREQLLDTIRHKMSIGELSRQPELEVESGGSGSANWTAKLEQSGRYDSARHGAPATSIGTKDRKRTLRSESSKEQEKAERMEDDDFFEVDSDSDSDSGSGAG